MVCVECVEGGPLYSALRSVPAKVIHRNAENRLQEDQNRLPTKNAPGKVPVQVLPNHWFGRLHFAASGHHLSLVHCLVGPDVRWSVPGLGWSVWFVWWASFACVTQDAIFCDFACVFFMFSSYSGLVLLKT